MLTITIFFLFVFALGSYRKGTEYGFPKEKTGFLKAVLPLFIILHHAHNGILTDFIPAGKYIVALFFCVSGYGLESKFIKNGVFSTRDLLHRLKSLLLPTIIPIVIYCVVLMFQQRDWFEVVTHSLQKISLPLPSSWFVVILAILYLLFFLASKSKRDVLILFILVFILNLILFVFFREQTYLYGSNFAFVMGGLLKRKENVILKLLKYRLPQMILPMALIVTYILIPYKTFAIINICIYAFIVMLLLYLTQYSYNSSSVLGHLKKISYENYLCHGILISILPYSKVGNILLYIIIIMSGTIILSTISYYFTHLVFRFDKK